MNPNPNRGLSEMRIAQQEVLNHANTSAAVIEVAVGKFDVAEIPDAAEVKATGRKLPVERDLPYRADGNKSSFRIIALLKWNP